MGSNESYINFNTNQEKIDKLPGKPRILVAPLDWGLGHATRSIPIIRMLLARGCDIWLAGEGAVRKLLSEEFPNLPFLPLKGYRIKYSRSGLSVGWAIFRQIPKILTAIRSENRWLAAQVRAHQFDAVISDNRFGLHHPAIRCIFITHQLAIRSSLSRWTDHLLQQFNYKYINRFSACWVPDAAGEAGLAGALSHPRKLPGIPVNYIGVISRLPFKERNPRPGHLLLVLSGPEPQRTLFENLLIDQLVHYKGTADFVRGLPLEQKILPSTNQLRFYNHLAAFELGEKMADSELVISRSGYTTVMDLVKLKKQAVLVPTPGQTEQEYLSGHLQERCIALSFSQKEFRLMDAVESARKFQYAYFAAEENALVDTIDNFLKNW